MKKVMKSLLLALVVFGSLNLNLNATDDTDNVDFAVINETEETVVIEESISYEIVPEDVPVATSRSMEPEVVYSEVYMGTIVEKEEVNAGNDVLVFDTEGTVELTVNENDVLVAADETTTTDTFTVENGQIVSAEDAFFMTSGGVGQTVDIYPTIEAASAGVNGTPINATGEDGQYIETVDYNEQDFVHVEISGYEGYMSIEDVQIVPTDFAQAQSFYVLQNGQWYYNVAVDPLTSTEYVTYPMATTPEWAVENVKYYSSDDVTFVAESSTMNTRSARASSSYASADYFQNLSIRSQASYTAKNYNDYLAYIGATDSQYYNHTSDFVQAQDVKQINSLFLFAFANHESAYGTSYYSYQCNNFFGRGAYDSNPDNACVEFGYPTPEDGILSQAFFLQNNYLDTDEFLYYGGYPGNLSGGMNVKYATDPNWGKAIASHMYQTDKALGSKEVNKYRTVALTTSVPAYTTSAMTTNVKTDKGNNYYFETGGRSNGNPTGGRGGTGIRAIVVEETPNAMKVQIETPMNTGASGNYATSSARRGSYPNYEGNMNPVYVPNGATSYAVNYGNFSSQQVWVPKSVNGKQTYTVLNDVPVNQENSSVCVTPPPVQNGDVFAFSPDGTVNCSKEYSNGVMVSETVLTYKNNVRYSYERKEYDATGTLVKTTSFKFNNKGEPASSVDILYSANTVVRKIEYKYDDNGAVQMKSVSEYKNSIVYNKRTENYDRNTLKSVTIDIYNETTGKLISSETHALQSNGKLFQINKNTYEGNLVKKEEIYKYDINGNEIEYFYRIRTSPELIVYEEINTYNAQHVLKSKKVLEYYSNTRLDMETINTYDNNGNLVNQKYNKFRFTDGALEMRYEKKYNASGYNYYYYSEEFINGVKSKTTLNEMNSKGELTRTYVVEYYSNGINKIIYETLYDSSKNPYVSTEQHFNSNGKRKLNVRLYYKNGVLTSRNYDSFDTEEKVYQTITDTMSNGVLTMSECTAFSTKGLPVQKNTNKYDANGNVTSIEIVYYDANGKPIRR